MYAQFEILKSYITAIMKDIIKECLRREAEALTLLVGKVDEEYVKIANLFAMCKGNLVFTGVGKSLQVGEKIASSFVSLGIKSIALDPLSMLHGDIGIFDKDDIFVCLSKSGETDILLDVVKCVKNNYQIPIVSVTGSYMSTLFRLSDYSIIVECEEAGPFNIVPTTSTTVMMAVGDALLCAVVNLKGITIDELKKNHPGGAIGKKINRCIYDY